MKKMENSKIQMNDRHGVSKAAKIGGKFLLFVQRRQHKLLFVNLWMKLRFKNFKN